MAAKLTEAEFSKHLNTTFRLQTDGEEALDLKLTEVKAYLPSPHEQQGMERFSAFFQGPVDRQLPQNTYTLNHESMGTFDIFLVPIDQNQQGITYEAVFNYFLRNESGSKVQSPKSNVR
jgi:hypothetical protein